MSSHVENWDPVIMSSPRRRGSREHVIPVKTGIQGTCHPRENGDPGIIYSRFPPARE
ncbi:MAG: hypothetical protein SFT93_00280 [Rickettsiaceae bacterium]|nr:hypothetical protein [Rickettsiaceae bacterium]